ncbi:MAG: adenylate kinase family protein [Thermoplasmata archaeon]|nr:adenylate kinase family protein [Thermoplasmata archaeon]
MTLYCLTGTPGTGKSSVSAELRSRGWDVVDGKAFLREHGLLGEYDAERDTYEVDLDDFNDALEAFRDAEGPVVLDSHLSHFMDSSGIVVLRCRPSVLAERLRARGYSEAKVRENVQAEILDEILVEATETDIPVGELDTTSATIAEIADAAEKIIRGHAPDYPLGSTDWSTEMEEWF